MSNNVRPLCWLWLGKYIRQLLVEERKGLPGTLS